MAQSTAQKRVPVKKAKPKAEASPALKPDTQSTYATGMAPRWLLADALMGGSEAMRRVGKDLLPKHDNETDDVYAARMLRSFLLPVFAQAVENLTDIVFSDAMTWSDKIPDDLAKMLLDVDADGNSIDTFGKMAFAFALAKGEVYLIADEPPLLPAEEGKVVTLADRRKQNVRPYLALVSGDNMLAFETETRAGVQTVVYARWRECQLQQNDDFTETLVQRVIEWRPGKYRRFEKVGDADWTGPVEGILNCKKGGKDFLPVVRFRIGSTDSAGLIVPPLQGLAEKNVEHWQSASDQRAILTVSRFPMLGGSGVDTESLETDDTGKSGIKIGPNVTLFSRDPNSEFYYVEPGGTAIEAGVKDLERLEKDMAQLAYQPLMRQQAGVTATTDALGQNKANCSLAAWAKLLGEALDKAVALLSIWQNKEPPVTAFKPNDEFGIEVIDATRVTALQGMRNSGDLSRGEFLKQMQRERVLDDEFDIEANEAQLANEGPTPGDVVDDDEEIEDDTDPEKVAA